MRTRRVLLALVVGAFALSGCALLTPITAPDLAPDGPVAVGSCLDRMNGRDSDRTSIVACIEPHLFEVTSIEEWPGMASMLEGSDPGKVWDAIHLVDGSGDGADYSEWASRECQDATLDVLDLNQVSMAGISSSKLKLIAGGSYGIDLSLGSRDEFVAGDHRTICSVAWYDQDGPREVVDPSGIGFAGYLGPGVPISERECWDSKGYEVSCTRPHAAQVVASFEAVDVFDDDIIEHTYDDTMTDDDYDLTDSFCDALMEQLLPRHVSGEVGYLAEASQGYGWDDWDGKVSDDGGYFYSCLLVARDTEALLSGDVFAGDVTVEGDQA